MEMEMEPADAPTLYDATERSDGVDGRKAGAARAAAAKANLWANPKPAVVGCAGVALLVLAAVLPAGQQAAEQQPSSCDPAELPPPCTTCRRPTWNWDVFPKFFHGSDPNGTAGGGFTPAALGTIARFPLITLEKWQGMDLTPYTWQEDAWVTAARQIKQRNPAATVLVWCKCSRSPFASSSEASIRSGRTPVDTVHIYEQDETLDPELEDHPGAWETGCTSGTVHSSIERRRPLFRRPFLTVTEPTPGVLAPLAGFLASRRREQRKDGEKSVKNGRDTAI